MLQVVVVVLLDELEGDEDVVDEARTPAQGEEQYHRHQHLDNLQGTRRGFNGIGLESGSGDSHRPMYESVSRKQARCQRRSVVHFFVSYEFKLF